MNGFYSRRNVFIHATPICHHIEHSVLVTRKVNILGKVVYFLNLSQMTTGRQRELDSVTDLLTWMWLQTQVYAYYIIIKKCVLALQ